MKFSKLLSFIYSLFPESKYLTSDIKIAIVDYLEASQVHFKTLLNILGHPILFICKNHDALIEKIDADNLPDIIIIDHDNTKLHDFKIMSWLKANYPSVKVIVIDMDNDENTKITLLMKGAKGFIQKDADFDVLYKAIRDVTIKGFNFPPDPLETLVRYGFNSQG